jgi:hypothetical protein
MKCKHNDLILPVVTEWQQDVQCPACNHYYRGQCVHPERDSPQAACPFDGKKVPLVPVAVMAPKRRRRTDP